MDSLYGTAGDQAATAFLTALWSLGIPVIVACAGVAWRVHRVAEDGVVKPLVTYVLALILIAWLLRPVSLGEGVRAPRFVAWLNDGCDLAVRRSIALVNRDFLDSPFRYERIAALGATAHATDPALREDLALFFASCTANAMAASGIADPDDPLSLPFDRLTFAATGRPCAQVRGELRQRLQADIDARELDAVWQAGITRDEFLAALVRNEWHGRVADGGEMARVRGSVGRYEQVERDLARHRGPPGDFEWLALLGEGVLTEWTWWGQLASDRVTSRQRYYLVTSYAPTLYGLILMLLTALFPVAAMWSIVPGKWTALVNFGKVYVSVKLWPLGWSLLSMFSARRPVHDALAEQAPPADVFTAVTLLYFLIPGLAFLVVNMASAAAAIPLKEPVVAGAGNGPAGQVAAMAVNRVR